MPAPRCNQHAAKPALLRKTRSINLRVTDAERAAIDQAAREHGLTPTVWVREILVAGAEKAGRLTAGLR